MDRLDDKLSRFVIFERQTVGVMEHNRLGRLRQLLNRPGGGGVYSSEFAVGVCRPVLQILPLSTSLILVYYYYFRPKHAIFHTRFQTWPLKSIPVFRPDIYVYKDLNYVTIA